jgi:NADP-dependent 3-hydroxy acid dehydrogenase YdfG
MGLATARLLVEDGGTVVLVARDENKLAREPESFGKGKVETIVADFCDWESVKAPVARIDIEARHINAHQAIKVTPSSVYSVQKNGLHVR